MKILIKKISVLSLACVMILSLTGCSLFESRATVYSRYITSLLDINYKNSSKDYMTLTGISQADAEAVYVENMDYQAHNLMNYYGIKEVDDGTVLSKFYYLAQSIFSNAKYEVTDVKHDKNSDSYTIELTIYPLDTLETSYPDVIAYIERFNSMVEDGDFNDTTEEDYETEFAGGIISILENASKAPGYLDPVVLEIPIAISNDYYSIADEDFIKIDSNILYVREDVEGTISTDGEDSGELTDDNGEEEPSDDGSE